MQSVIVPRECHHFLHVSNNSPLVQLQVTHYCYCLGNEELVNLFILSLLRGSGESQLFGALNVCPSIKTIGDFSIGLITLA